MNPATDPKSDDGLGTAGPYERLEQLGFRLPAPRAPVANFVVAVRHADLVYLSGQGPVTPDGIRSTGKVGRDVTIEQAYADARLTTINLLAALEHEIGSLKRVQRIVKVLGFVNAVEEFEDHPKVINGCSDLLTAVFGPEAGSHARSAIGAGSLPRGISVELEMIVAIKS